VESALPGRRRASALRAGQKPGGRLESLTPRTLILLGEAGTLNGVPASPFSFPCDCAARRRDIALIARRLPALRGEAVDLHDSPGLRDRRGPVHAGSFLRQRRILFDCTAAEFPRIFVHEVFHFVWLRFGNARRRSWEAVLARELEAGARGELGWSAEWRKAALQPADCRKRSRRWREYCCEAFCDSAAWMYSGVRGHAEFTLADRFRERRRMWFESVTGSALSI
jgi:hypothetical protein